MLTRERGAEANPTIHDSEEGREATKTRDVSQPLQQEPQQGPVCSGSSSLAHPTLEFLHWRLSPKLTPFPATAANGTSKKMVLTGASSIYTTLSILWVHPEEKNPHQPLQSVCSLIF